VAVVALSAVAVVGLGRMAAEARTLYEDDTTAARASADLVAATLTVHESALYELATDDPGTAADLAAEMDDELLPSVYGAIRTLRESLDGPEIADVEHGIQEYLAVRRAFVNAHAAAATAAEKSDLADQTDELLEGVVDSAKGINAQVRTAEAAREAKLEATYTATQRLVAAGVAGVLLLGLAVAFVLSRDLLPRIREYAAFARSVSAGRPTTPLEARGGDELTVLGTALNDMVLQRERSDAAQRQQTEFVETLQVVGSEDEAHLLIQRHLQRAVAASAVLVFKRNNSANRLEVATGVPRGSELVSRLAGLEPNDCVAIRLGRTHQEGGSREPLLSCQVCGGRDGYSTCEPLLVSGQVIGSVLVSHTELLDPAGRSRVRSTVSQASPMLANLRNLALAEFRASNDPLTNLPNKRATEDTLRAMVAQANRTQEPLSAAMLDLDHFKEINDRFGHAHGDEVLAAVGAAIRSSLRPEDFAGRFGGEEFLVLFPRTDAEEAVRCAERIRLAIAAIRVPGVDRYISASLGVAEMREPTGTPVGLLRGADKAQYAAKNAGRDRVVLAETPESVGTA
jgi:diguanylate cyclase (GGDEF)-like protein